MSQRDSNDAEEFDEAVRELFRTGQPIEAPLLEMLAAWDVDLDDEGGRIEGAVRWPSGRRSRRVTRAFAARVIKALGRDRAWQKPWKPGERILPHNFQSGRDYRGGNALYLALNALDRGYADPRWGGYRQIQEAGGHVRKGEKGSPILYVDFNHRQTARDEQGKPVLDEAGRPRVEWVRRDKLHHVFNVEQTKGLQLRSLATAAPAWEGHERAEALIKASGVRVDHVAGDRADYSVKDDRVVLPDRSQFPSQDAYTHTALHELGHATVHPSRLKRPTLVEHGGFGTEAYAREELRAGIAAMMTGEQLGVGHEPRHGTAYVQSWIKALEKETRSAAVDAQRISDWLISRERERSRSDEQPEHDPYRAGGGAVPGGLPAAGVLRPHRGRRRGVARLVGESEPMREPKARNPASPPRRSPWSSTARPEPARRWSPARSTRRGRAPGPCSSRSSARCSATICSSPSCSATPGAPSPARRRTARGCWSCPPAAPSSSTRWPS